MKLKKPLWPLVFGLFSLLSCTPAFQGEYADPDAMEIVDDKWNEKDGGKTSEVLIQSMMKRPWLDSFRSEHNGTKPVLIVGEIENRTDEHIDTSALIEGIRTELINAQSIRFVDGPGRDKILKEIRFQTESGMVAKDSAKQKGRQIGADFLLTGILSSQVHTQQGLKTVTYQTILQLTNLETAEIVWNEKFAIKKRFNRSSSGW